jgi:hypothetical protein
MFVVKFTKIIYISLNYELWCKYYKLLSLIFSASQNATGLHIYLFFWGFINENSLMAIVLCSA